MIGSLYWIPLVLIIILLWYKWSTRNSKYFEKIGLPYRKQTLLLGDLVTIIVKKKSLLDILTEVYNLYPNERIIGTFDFSKPAFLLRDPALIRKISINDFDHFTDRISFELTNDLIGKSLQGLNGQKWKDMRTTLTPAFTGSKIKQMFELINDCALQMSNYFLKNADDTRIVDIRDVFSRLTVDSIATSAFGIKIDSFTDPDNEFSKLAQTLVKPNFSWLFLKMFFIQLLPNIAKLLKLRIFGEKIDKFFRSLIIDSMKIRAEQNIYRPDMIHLLMQVRKGGIKDDNERNSDGSTLNTQQEKSIGGKAKIDWTDDYLIAQCLQFFFAGSAPITATLTFLSYELATNPDIQQKLIKEIDEAERKNPEGLTYSTLLSLKYLDMVISEILRKWPPGAVTDRVCVKDYDIYENDKVRFKIEKGKTLTISIHSIHRDSQYFHDPDRFDPERFSEENIDKIVTGSYIPFGGGPRNCIGSRLALMELKTFIYNLLKNFTLEVCEKTEIPLKLSGFIPLPKTLYLELRNRNK